MSSLVFASEQRRNFTTPIVIAFIVLAIVIGAVFYFNPHRQGELSAVRTDIFAPETTFKAPAANYKGMNIVGQAPEVERELYAVVTIHIQNDHRLPAFLDEIDGKYIASNNDELTAISPGTASDLARVEEVFPGLKQLLPHPLFRGDTIPPKGSLDGQVLLSFGGVSADAWKTRKPSEIAVNFAHQKPMTAIVP